MRWYTFAEKKRARRAAKRKLLETALLILNKLPQEQRTESVLYDAMFMADMAHYREHAKSITGAQWRKTRKGPRPSPTLVIVDEIQMFSPT